LEWQCGQCGGPIEIANLPPFNAAAIKDEWSLWRYEAMLPVSRRFSLGGGLTPLIEAAIPGASFLAKLDYLNPTGSYKDRGTETLISYLLAHGVTEVVEDSSGNAGSSLAAYAGGAGIHARIFAPTSAPAGKKRQIAMSAELVEVPGPRYAVTDACVEAAFDSVYASHAWSPFFIAGQMTCAWEIWEQMGRNIPDAIACPVGHGGLFLGLARGFDGLQRAGLIDRIPRLYAIQSTACDPIVTAWENNSDTPTIENPDDTVADGIVVKVPVRGKAVMQAMSDSGGAAFRVTDEAILEARDTLAARGLFVEPTSAVPIAAFDRIREHAGHDATLLIPLTGNGLKSVKS
jgi:threonine synthase